MRYSANNEIAAEDYLSSKPNIESAKLNMRVKDIDRANKLSVRVSDESTKEKLLQVTWKRHQTQPKELGMLTNVSQIGPAKEAETAALKIRVEELAVDKSGA